MCVCVCVLEGVAILYMVDCAGQISMPFVVISGMHQLPSSLSTGTTSMYFSQSYVLVLVSRYRTCFRVKDITISYFMAFLSLFWNFLQVLSFL